jgi:hypothetical protein
MDSTSRRRKTINPFSDSQLESGLSHTSHDIVNIGLDNLTKKFKVKTNRNSVRERSNSAPAKMPRIEDCQFSWSLVEDQPNQSSERPHSPTLPRAPVASMNYVSQERSKRSGSLPANNNSMNNNINSSAQQSTQGEVLPNFKQFLESVNKNDSPSSMSPSATDFGNISLEAVDRLVSLSESKPLSTPSSMHLNPPTDRSTSTSPVHFEFPLSSNTITPRRERSFSPSGLSIQKLLINEQQYDSSTEVSPSPSWAGASSASSMAISPNNHCLAAVPFTTHVSEQQHQPSIASPSSQFTFQPAPFLFRPVESNRHLMEKFHEQMKNPPSPHRPVHV